MTGSYRNPYTIGHQWRQIPVFYDNAFRNEFAIYVIGIKSATKKNKIRSGTVSLDSFNFIESQVKLITSSDYLRNLSHKLVPSIQKKIGDYLR